MPDYAAMLIKLCDSLLSPTFCYRQRPRVEYRVHGCLLPSKAWPLAHYTMPVDISTVSASAEFLTAYDIGSSIEKKSKISIKIIKLIIKSIYFDISILLLKIASSRRQLA